jgi:hypothetical protein
MNHELLLSKLQFYGVRGVILYWLKSYLTNRKQRVDLESINLHNYTSGWDTVKCGVPQGSVLGPLLFNIHINDFPVLIRKYSHIILFADDTSILATSNNCAELNQNLNFLLQFISKWLKINQLVLNTNEVYIVKFLSYKGPIYPLHLIDADQILSVTDTIKFLGLHLDSHLSWKSHTIVLVRKLSSVCYVMRKLSDILNIVTLRIVYFAYFQSLVTYGISFWGSSSTMHNVFLIQKKNY